MTLRSRPTRGVVMSRLAGAVGLLALTLAIGCSEEPAASSAAAIDAVAASAPARTPAAATPAAPPEVGRVLAHVNVLAGEIGNRAAGTAGERRAADYVASSLRAAGYDVAVEPFTFDLRFDTSSVTLADGALKALALTGSPQGEARGGVVMAGLGRPDDFSLRDVRGKVVFVDRGSLPFGQKAANAEGAGAVALIVVNNEPGQFRGSLGEARVSIPVLAVDRSARGRLLAASQAGEAVTVTAAAGSRQTPSQNVVGRGGGACEVYLGAHYDSVPEGPGANDNASGTAMLLELARVHRRPGLCVVAFGAEEYGLWGSQAYLKQHGTAGARFMLNFDMVGKVTGPEIVGEPGLQERVLGLLKQAGKTGFHAGQFPPFASSDHASFVSSGIPAVTFYSGDDPLIHDPADTVANVDRASIETMLAAGDLAISGLLGAAR